MQPVLVRYFNANGKCLYKLTLEENEHLLGDSSQQTTAMQGAYGTKALLGQVIEEYVSIQFARKARTVSVGDRQPVAIGDVLPELESCFGAVSVQWAAAIFLHLKIQPPSLQ